MRWSSLSAFASAPPFDLWPSINTAAFQTGELERYTKREQAIRAYADGVPTDEIFRITGVTRRMLVDLSKKCLSLANDGKIFGFRGLILYIRTKEYTRTAPVSHKFPESKAGQSGTLGALLNRFPGFEDRCSNKGINCICNSS